MRRYTKGAVIGALLLVGSAAGCASLTGGRSAAASAGDGVSVVVTNDNWQDATIYAVGVGPSVRLGTVTSMKTERFRVPPGAMGPGTVQLRAELLGSSAARTTDPIMIQPGEAVYWTIQNYLPLSSYAVR